MEQPLLTIEEVEALVGVRTISIHRYMRSRRFPQPVVAGGPGGRRAFWDRREVERWCKAHAGELLAARARAAWVSKGKRRKARLRRAAAAESVR